MAAVNSCAPELLENFTVIFLAFGTEGGEIEGGIGHQNAVVFGVGRVDFRGQQRHIHGHRVVLQKFDLRLAYFDLRAALGKAR